LETLCPAPYDHATAVAGTSPFFGGMKFIWGQGADGVTLNESEPQFRQISLKACDLIGQIVVSNGWLMDIGPESEEFLYDLFGRAAAWHKEDSFLRGTGVNANQPLGILNSGSLISSTRAVASQVSIADIALMASKLIPYSWNHSIWACSPSVLAQVAKVTGFVPNEDPLGTEQGCAGSLLSRPLFVTEKLPILGAAGDLIFFDPSLYVIGNRQEIVIEASPHPLFQNYQTVIRVWLRCDGKPLTDFALTLADASSTASPFVALAAA
jgi:HK97 family phage major capsid protein